MALPADQMAFVPPEGQATRWAGSNPAPATWGTCPVAGELDTLVVALGRAVERSALTEQRNVSPDQPD